MTEVSINKQGRLSQHLTSSSVAAPHFTLGELCKTKTGIENVPNEAQVENLKRLCRWLEQLRRRWNNLYGDGDDPIVINSGFRSPEVNKAVGGVATSNHLTGCAVGHLDSLRRPFLGQPQAHKLQTLKTKRAASTRCSSLCI